MPGLGPLPVCSLRWLRLLVRSSSILVSPSSDSNFKTEIPRVQPHAYAPCLPKSQFPAKAPSVSECGAGFRLGHGTSCLAMAVSEVLRPSSQRLLREVTLSEFSEMLPSSRYWPRPILFSRGVRCIPGRLAVTASQLWTVAVSCTRHIWPLNFNRFALRNV